MIATFQRREENTVILPARGTLVNRRKPQPNTWILSAPALEYFTRLLGAPPPDDYNHCVRGRGGRSSIGSRL